MKIASVSYKYSSLLFLLIFVIPNSNKSSEFKTSSLSRNRNFIATFSILETAARVSLPYKRHIFHWLLPYKLHTNFYQLWLCARHHAPRIAIGTAPHQRQAVPHKGRHPAAQLAAEAEASYAVPTASGKIVALAAGGDVKRSPRDCHPNTTIDSLLDLEPNTTRSDPPSSAGCCRHTPTLTAHSAYRADRAADSARWKHHNGGANCRRAPSRSGTIGRGSAG